LCLKQFSWDLKVCSPHLGGGGEAELRYFLGPSLVTLTSGCAVVTVDLMLEI